MNIFNPLIQKYRQERPGLSKNPEDLRKTSLTHKKEENKRQLRDFFCELNKILPNTKLFFNEKQSNYIEIDQVIDFLEIML